MPGTAKEEAGLIRKTLCSLLAQNDGIKITEWFEAEKRLNSKAVDAENRLGSPWPNVLARPVRRTTHISKATGQRALAKVLDALSLLHTGKVKLVGESTTFLPELLIYSPALRFDPLR
jgi:hypothetical protein